MADSSTKNKLEMAVRTLRAGILPQSEYRNIATLLEEEVLPLVEDDIDLRVNAWQMVQGLGASTLEDRIAAADKLMTWLKGE